MITSRHLGSPSRYGISIPRRFRRILWLSSGLVTQLEAEFGEPGFNRDTRELSVITDRIELEGIDLGDFEIRLHVGNLGAGQFNSLLSVIALDPHPAASNRRVTHPHVNDEQLCAGDGRAAIQAALHNGRICDFFV
ncbi:MAG TPA: hypothetical protein VM487_21695, partial [Phycisphaerae bacterium]|nr:hypothetical protein [Phycisphaerae bacterium]